MSVPVPVSDALRRYRKSLVRQNKGAPTRKRADCEACFCREWGMDTLAEAVCARKEGCLPVVWNGTPFLLWREDADPDDTLASAQEQWVTPEHCDTDTEEEKE